VFLTSLSLTTLENYYVDRFFFPTVVVLPSVRHRLHKAHVLGESVSRCPLASEIKTTRSRFAGASQKEIASALHA
jgi:hypothetical protein